MFLGDRARRRARAARPRARSGPGVRPAVDFIAELRQAADLAALPVGRRVVVIGGGMTAIDAGGAVEEARRRGGDDRLPPRPRADGRQRLRAGARGDAPGCGSSRARCRWRCGATARCARWSSPTPRTAGGPARDGETFVLAADQVLTAIGQTLGATAGGAGGGGRQDRGRPGRGAPACRGLGRRRLRRRRRRPDGDGGGRGAGRGHGHPRRADGEHERAADRRLRRCRADG